MGSSIHNHLAIHLSIKILLRNRKYCKNYLGHLLMISVLVITRIHESTWRLGSGI